MSSPVVIELDPGDRVVLAGWVARPTAQNRQRIRARIVLLAADKVSNQQIAVRLGVCVDTVRKWRGRFAARGLHGLADQPRSGRPPKCTALQTAQIKAIACSPPAERGLPLARWSVTEIVTQAVSDGIIEQIRRAAVMRCLAADAIKPWQYRYWISPTDPDFATKAARVLDLYQRTWQGQPLGEDVDLPHLHRPARSGTSPRPHQSWRPDGIVGGHGRREDSAVRQSGTDLTEDSYPRARQGTQGAKVLTCGASVVLASTNPRRKGVAMSESGPVSAGDISGWSSERSLSHGRRATVAGVDLFLTRRQMLTGIGGLSAAALVAACTSPGGAEAPAGSGAPTAAGSAGGAPTLAIVNARVWTGDPANPTAEAVAIAGDRIVAVGSSAEIRDRAGNAQVIDASGQFLVPGFIDAHEHFMDGGMRRASVQLRDVTTREEFIRRIGEHAKTVPAGSWIIGGDWDHTAWGGELPQRSWIDPVTPNTPVWITRLDGHMALANTAALNAVGLTRDVQDVAGGEIIRDAQGELTGVLKDNAMSLVNEKMPPPTAETQDKALDAAMAYVAENGVTAVHTMATWEPETGWPDLPVYQRANQASKLKTRIYAAVPLETWERLVTTVSDKTYGGQDGKGDGWFRIGLVKGFVDGSAGSHTAAFEEPYTDTPDQRGNFITTEDKLYQWVSGADKAGLQVTVHAIGDRANRTILDIYERVAGENGQRDRRFRVEHAQHLAQAEIPRFGELGVIPSMQPYHAIDDGRWVEGIIGPDRIKRTYAFKSLLDNQAQLAFGSDWYVAPPSPILGIYAAVTRRTLDDKNPDGWVPEQKITVEQALTAYTTGSAYASFAENDTGRIAPGMLADLTLIDRDLRQIPPGEIRDAQVVRTIVGGETVYER